jgi:hypothetical protein
MAEKEVGANFRGNLTNLATQREVGVNCTQEGILPGFKSHSNGDNMGSQNI